MFHIKQIRGDSLNPILFMIVLLVLPQSTLKIVE